MCTRKLHYSCSTINIRLYCLLLHIDTRYQGIQKFQITNISHRRCEGRNFNAYLMSTRPTSSSCLQEGFVAAERFTLPEGPPRRRPIATGDGYTSVSIRTVRAAAAPTAAVTLYSCSVCWLLFLFCCCILDGRCLAASHLQSTRTKRCLLFVDTLAPKG